MLGGIFNVLLKEINMTKSTATIMQPSFSNTWNQRRLVELKFLEHDRKTGLNSLVAIHGFSMLDFAEDS